MFTNSIFLRRVSIKYDFNIFIKKWNQFLLKAMVPVYLEKSFNLYLQRNYFRLLYDDYY